ncbi:MAG: glucose-6-phosphate isomerase [Burkholderiaceae bacterium]|nr:glucose-6-phosphate isomerase [Burkholderiaceae bacterium]
MISKDEGNDSDKCGSARAEVHRLADAMRDASIVELLRDEPQRQARLAVDAAGIHADFTRHRLPLPALDALFALAREVDLEGQRNAMFDGASINFTEKRPALHVALRRPAHAGSAHDPVAAEVARTFGRMFDFADAVRDGRWKAAGGERIATVVHVGIGGSHLGPQLACEALVREAGPLDIRFLSNVDPDSFARATAGVDPRTTLAIVASKSWHTTETARNAQALRRWFASAGIEGEALQRHFVAVTSNVEAASGFGLAADALFPMWDWVGGRYSLWSAIGLPIALSIGSENFRAMLDGAHAMDRHFREAPLERNAPVLMALVSLWNRLVLDGGTEVVVPYSDALRSLVAYLQQLQMESNGKRIGRDGEPVPWETVPAIWGSTGTDAQHSFFQALHQGTSVHPVDFIVVVPSAGDDEHRGRALLANALAQVEALACGRHSDDADPLLAKHRSTPGNRPSSVLLLDALDARSFGALIALYEHKTASLGWLWRIDSFDQWGVELGKVLAADIEPMLAEGAEATGAADGKQPAHDGRGGSACPDNGQSHATVQPLIRRIRKALADRDARRADPPAA